MRVQIIFYGTVQGVGFRYNAFRIARRHGIRGFVRNRSDGTVVTELEATQDEIDAFFSDLSHTMYGYIESTEYNRMACDHGYLSFDIRY